MLGPVLRLGRCVRNTYIIFSITEVKERDDLAHNLGFSLPSFLLGQSPTVIAPKYGFNKASIYL